MAVNATQSFLSNKWLLLFVNTQYITLFYHFLLLKHEDNNKFENHKHSIHNMKPILRSYIFW
jgi:hypothetical protein